MSRVCLVASGGRAGDDGEPRGSAQVAQRAADARREEKKKMMMRKERKRRREREPREEKAKYRPSIAVMPQWRAGVPAGTFLIPPSILE